MHKVIVLMLLAMVSWGISAAEWLPVTRSEIATYYVDQATIHKAGDRVKIWELIDYKKAKIGGNGKPYFSIKLQTEYACKEAQYRMLFFSSTSGNMGGGIVVSSKYFTTEWLPTSSNSVADMMKVFACAKR